ncbi:MAG TPA: hypothetical protein VIQ29_10275 [Ancylobacter sp.]
MLKSASVVLCLLAGLTAASAQAPAVTPPAADAPLPGQEPAPAPLPEPVACIFDKVFLCEAEKGCSAAKELGEIDLPAKFMVNFDDKMIASTNDDGLPYMSPIESASTSGDNITLQGSDGLVGWVMQMSRTEPGATLTTVSHEAVITSFGTCKPAS